MEIVIVIFLPIAIFLLLQNNIVIKNKSEQKPVREKVNPNLPDIMGQSKPKKTIQCQTLPMKAKYRNRKYTPKN